MQNSYLLRFWRDDSTQSWRATLVSVTPGATERHFAHVSDLVRFLEKWYTKPPQTNAPDADPADFAP